MFVGGLYPAKWLSRKPLRRRAFACLSCIIPYSPWGTTYALAIHICIWNWITTVTQWITNIFWMVIRQIDKYNLVIYLLREWHVSLQKYDAPYLKRRCISGIVRFLVCCPCHNCCPQPRNIVHRFHKVSMPCLDLHTCNRIFLYNSCPRVWWMLLRIGGVTIFLEKN